MIKWNIGSYPERNVSVKQVLNPRPKDYKRLGVRLSKSLKEDI